MRKHGFTLAEILITLSIIGVVAALTAPTLVNNASNAQIRPTLTKAVSALEQVNLDVINRRELDSLLDIDINNDFNDYFDGNDHAGIVNLLSGATVDNNTNTIHMKGNIDLIFTRRNNPPYNPQGGLRGHFADVIIDIDGVGGQTADRLGSDWYQFAIDGSGSVLPYGGRALFTANPNLGYWNSDNNEVNNNNGPFCDSVETAQADGTNCAGSVMENDDIIFR